MTGYPRHAAVVAGTALTLLGLSAPAVASPVPDFEAPFPCRQLWSAASRPEHSPSRYSVDFNRDDDYRNAVLSSAAGVVTSVTDVGGTSYGKYVVVDHGGEWSSLFAHLDEQWVVTGQWVDQGQYIGLLGTSGGSTGPHLHFEQRLNRINQPAVFHGNALVYNTEIRSRNCGDVPVVGDWNGDKRTDLGAFRRGGKPTFLLRRPGGAATVVTYGAPTSEPVVGDWNGDGTTNLGTWDRSSRTFSWRSPSGGTTSLKFGGFRDKPVAGDWDGDGRTDVGVFRPTRATFRLRAADGSITRIRFGRVGSIPVTGDWDGDQHTDVGVFDPVTREWVLRRGDGSLKTFPYGARGTLPVVGDWNGNAITDVGVWSPRSGTFSLRVAHGNRTRLVEWGRRR
ncbi:MAG: peptidoglycan DD-metalloendopeptidase family protein [Nocardioidaceae bacterium]